MKTAIYVRQSLEKEGSLSIEGQIRRCRVFIGNDESEIYSDCGYSGKNSKRPAFEKLLKDVKNNLIDRVVIYRFDRISRSLIDFINIQDIFEKNNVRLISCSENFDTSSEIGKLMLKLLIMFAEMERNSIIRRISDNYAYRAEKMCYLGGNLPFGYCLKDGNIIFDEEKLAIIQQIFKLYVEKDFNLDKTASYLNQNNIKTANNSIWRGSRISSVLKSVFYVEKSPEIEKYFCENNYELKLSDEEYNGYIQVKNTIYSSLHYGIISSDLWIRANEKIKRNKRIKNLGKGKSSFLQGMIICEKCGKSVYFKSNGKGKRYLQCQGKRIGICDGYKSLDPTELENSVLSTIKGRISKLKRLNLELESKDFVEIDNEILFYKNKENKTIEESQKMNDLISKKTAILRELNYKNDFSEKKLQALPNSSKKAIVKVFIKSITINDGKVCVYLY